MLKFISSAVLLAVFSTCAFAQGHQATPTSDSGVHRNRSENPAQTARIGRTSSSHLCYARSRTNEVYGGETSQLATDNCEKYTNTKCSSLGCDDKL